MKTIILSLALALSTLSQPNAKEINPAPSTNNPVTYRTVSIDGVDIFYREAGDPARPTVVLLHGFPTSSHMYRNLIPVLAAEYHVIAPDFPGFGLSSAPASDSFAYTFDHLAEITSKFLAVKKIEQYTLYVMDYGAPVGYRIAAAAPEKVTGLIIQNGNAYAEGLSDAWAPIKAYWKEQSPENARNLRQFVTPALTKFQYIHGSKDPERISPDNWIVDQTGLDRPGNSDIQLALFLDYQNNLDRYPAWHAYFRKHQPPALIVWGKNDPFFTEAGAQAYLRDLPGAELHFFDTGHFALEEAGNEIAALILTFLARRNVQYQPDAEAKTELTRGAAAARRTHDLHNCA